MSLLNLTYNLWKDELVAVKMIKLDCDHKLNSFHRERNGLHMKHPNIVSTISVFQGPKYGMVVMKKAPKTTLQQFMLLNPLSDRLKLS